MYLIDPATRKATSLTLPSSLQKNVNCITLINPVQAYVGTVGTGGPAELFRITIAGTKVSATKLNTSALAGGNLAQIVPLGSNLYFTTQDNSNKGGILQSVPSNGGAPTTLMNLGTSNLWPKNNLANSVAGFGNRIFVGTWGTNPVVLAYDTGTKKLSTFFTLPRSKALNTYFYPVNMQAGVIGGKLTLAVCGLYGDLAYFNLITGKLIAHYVAGRDPSRSTVLNYNYSNSFAFNRDTGDWGIGTRDGALDIVVPVGSGHAFQRAVDKLGSHPTITSNSVNGIAYVPAGSKGYSPYGAGCSGNTKFTPTSGGFGIPIKGNKNFSFGVGSATNGIPALLLVGTTALALDLTAAGAPGCFLRQNNIFILPTVTAGSKAGLGQAFIPIPLPNVGATLYTQWGIVDASANSLKVIFSDGRKLVL
jgi:uncharacterized repeat protein (TIGR03803 family)